MSARRRIDALRAKADSTTFPAEAAALRAKADELEAALPPPPASVVYPGTDPGCVVMYGPGNGFFVNGATVTTTATGVTITFNLG